MELLLFHLVLIVRPPPTLPQLLAVFVLPSPSTRLKVLASFLNTENQNIHPAAKGKGDGRSRLPQDSQRKTSSQWVVWGLLGAARAESQSQGMKAVAGVATLLCKLTRYQVTYKSFNTCTSLQGGHGLGLF